MKMCIYCYFIADILTKVFFRNIWVVLYQTYTFCPNLSIWLVVMATKGLNLQNDIKTSSWNFAEMFIALGSTKIAVAYAL